MKRGNNCETISFIIDESRRIALNYMISHVRRNNTFQPFLLFLEAEGYLVWRKRGRLSSLERAVKLLPIDGGSYHQSSPSSPYKKQQKMRY